MWQEKAYHENSGEGREMNRKEILQKLTLEEKAALLCGTDFMYTNPIPRLNIPAVSMSDGPHGLRKQKGDSQDNGVSESEPATSFPTAATTASSWNPENVYKMGKAIAVECANHDVDILLGPGVNIKRNPLCGRNFEYFSEDPLLAGAFGAAEVQGVQENGVGVSVKHFALNNSENYRFMGNSVADERAIREIYLKPFECVVKEAKPATLMCAYNKINGTYCCENEWLLTDVLRKEWGFNGSVMSDWGATHNRVKGVAAGLELEMPGDVDICRKWIIDAVKDGSLPEEKLNERVENALQLIDRCQENKKKRPIQKGGLTEKMRDEHHALAAQIAIDSAVLLKNDGVLPLNESEKVLVVGELFEKMRYQGAGSSMIHPARICTPKQAFDQASVRYQYVKGYHENRVEAENELIEAACNEAKKYDTVVVFAGLTDYVESEGCDRESMKLPQNQLALIEKLSSMKKKTVIVLFGGSSVELPFADDVSAILDMYLPGQNGGLAARELLYGKANPSGRLAETWVKQYGDVPFSDTFGKTDTEAYKESIFVGYRYYETAGKEVRYPFGYGLSYTEFAYGNCKLEATEQGIRVTAEITNTGARDGAEVVQCYASGPATDLFKPLRELKAFAKVYLKAGETKQTELLISWNQLQIFSMKEQRWIMEEGAYKIAICKNAHEEIWSDKVEVTEEMLDGCREACCFRNDGELVNPEQECKKNVKQASCDGRDKIYEIYASADLSAVTDDIFEQMSGIKIPPKTPSLPITLESRFTDLKQTFMGRILFGAVLATADKSEKEALKLPEGTERDNKLKGAIFLRRILESNSVMTMCMSAGKSLPYNMAVGMVELANGHLIRGIKAMISAPKVPKLPKEEV